MGLTGYERNRLTGLWRTLANLALGDDVEALKQQAGPSREWASPLDDAADAFVLYALARLAYAQSRTRAPERARRRPALTSLALLALDLLGGPPPEPEAAQRRLPYAD